MGLLFGKEGGEGDGESKPPFLRTGKFSSDDLRVESPKYEAPDPMTTGRAAPDAPKPRLEVHRAERPDYSWSDEVPPEQGKVDLPAPPNTYFARRSSAVDFIIAFVLSVGAAVAVLLTYFGIGYSWDEALYLNPAKNAAEWMTTLLSGDTQAFNAEVIEKYWGGTLDSQDPNHPEIAPIPKFVIGLGASLLPRLGADPMTATRIPIAVFFGLTIGLLYLIGAREYGRIGGFAAAFAYALSPRVFGHAHIAASETLLAFSIAFLVWSYLATIASWPAVIFTALAFAFAIDTKVTALLLPLPLFLWGQIYFRGRYGRNVLAMLFVSPLIAFVLWWPWLWNNGIPKLLGYLAFYARHQSTAVFYQGQMWGYVFRDNLGHLVARPPAPWHYPIVITALSLPEWVLALFAIGLLRALFMAGTRAVSLLFVIMWLFLVGLASLPNMPKYDGERLFFPAFLFVALLAGGGFSMFFALPQADPSKPALLRGTIAGIFLLGAAFFGVAELSRSHPNELNYFNRIVGGSKGAYVAGYETSYWGEAVNNDVLEYLNANLRPGDRVKTLALNEEVFLNLQQWDKLAHGVDFSPIEAANLIVLQVRQGFLGEFERKLRRTEKPLQVFEAQGVPRIEIYKGDRGTTAARTEEATTATAVIHSQTTETVASDTGTTETGVESVTTMPTAAIVIETTAPPRPAEPLPLQHPQIQFTPAPASRPAGRARR